MKMGFKQTELDKNLNAINRLYAKSDDAISLVSSTIDKLTNINIEIENKQTEISTLVGIYAKTMTNMSDAHHKNVALINNFSKLLEV